MISPFQADTIKKAQIGFEYVSHTIYSKTDRNDVILWFSIPFQAQITSNQTANNVMREQEAEERTPRAQRASTPAHTGHASGKGQTSQHKTHKTTHKT